MISPNRSGPSSTLTSPMVQRFGSTMDLRVYVSSIPSTPAGGMPNGALSMGSGGSGVFGPPSLQQQQPQGQPPMAPGGKAIPPMCLLLPDSPAANVNTDRAAGAHVLPVPRRLSLSQASEGSPAALAADGASPVRRHPYSFASDANGVPPGAAAGGMSTSQASNSNLLGSSLVDSIRLGFGASGNVHVGQHRSLSGFIARKLIRETTDSKVRNALAELNFARRAIGFAEDPNGSPGRRQRVWRNVVEVHEVVRDPEARETHITMELMQGETAASLALRSEHDDFEPQLRRLTRDVLAGLAVLHDELFVLHRDLKPSNVLFDSEGNAKIADFGVCAVLNGPDALATDQEGTTAFMSPERLRGEKHGHAGDVWSLGVMLLQLAMGGRHPFLDIVAVSPLKSFLAAAPPALVSPRALDEDAMETPTAKVAAAVVAAAADSAVAKHALESPTPVKVGADGSAASSGKLPVNSGISTPASVASGIRPSAAAGTTGGCGASLAAADSSGVTHAISDLASPRETFWGLAEVLQHTRSADECRVAVAEAVDAALTQCSVQSDAFADLIHRCLASDPEKRPRARDLLSHQWFF